jgi:hypothetical protein
MELQVTPGALKRHGLLYDLIEREDDTNDTRAVTVARFAKRVSSRRSSKQKESAK